LVLRAVCDDGGGEKLERIEGVVMVERGELFVV